MYGGGGRCVRRGRSMLAKGPHSHETPRGGGEASAAMPSAWIPPTCLPPRRGMEDRPPSSPPSPLPWAPPG